jgi:hypothetical protein
MSGTWRGTWSARFTTTRSHAGQAEQVAHLGRLTSKKDAYIHATLMEHQCMKTMSHRVCLLSLTLQQKAHILAFVGTPQIVVSIKEESSMLKETLCVTLTSPPIRSLIIRRRTSMNGLRTFQVIRDQDIDAAKTPSPCSKGILRLSNKIRRIRDDATRGVAMYRAARWYQSR